MLYTLSKSPYQMDFQALLSLVDPSDAILLMQDGVLAVRAVHYARQLSETGAQLYALNEDCEARGINLDESETISLVNYMGFVRLTIEYPQQFAW